MKKKRKRNRKKMMKKLAVSVYYCSSAFESCTVHIRRAGCVSEKAYYNYCIREF